MALPVEQFPILSFAQNNPGLAGAQMMENIRQQGLRNQLLQQQSAVNPQMLQSQLALQQAKVPEVQAQTSALNKKTSLANLMASIQAQDAMTRAGALGQSQSRFGPAFQLSKSLQSMAPSARQSWIAQNQGEYSQMVNQIASSVNQQKASTGQSNFLTPAMVHQMMSGAGGNLPQQQQGGAPQQMQQGGPQQMQQGMPLQMQQGGQQPQQQGMPQPQQPQAPSLVQQLSEIRQGQGGQQPAQPAQPQGAFTSSPEQVAQVQRANEMAANQGLTTTATRKRAEAGAALDQFLSKPELNQAFQTMSQYAGAGGRLKALEESYLNPGKYAAYQSASQQMPSILSGAISQLEGFPTSDQGINRGLNFFKMAQKSLSSDPHAAMDMFRQGVETLRARNQTIQASASPLFDVNRLRGGSNVPRGTSQAAPTSGITREQALAELKRRGLS